MGRKESNQTNIYMKKYFSTIRYITFYDMKLSTEKQLINHINQIINDISLTMPCFKDTHKRANRTIICIRAYQVCSTIFLWQASHYSAIEASVCNIIL